MPATAAGCTLPRLPNSPYYTSSSSPGPELDQRSTPRDSTGYGLKLASAAARPRRFSQDVGQSYSTIPASRAATFQLSRTRAGPVSSAGHRPAPYCIPSGRADPAFQPAAPTRSLHHPRPRWDSHRFHRPDLGCVGTLPAILICAAVQPALRQLPSAQHRIPASFLLAAPGNYYAPFWHHNGINGKQLRLPLRRLRRPSSDLSITTLVHVVAVGW